MPLDLVVVQPTSICNLNCSYCYLPEKERRIKSKIDYETVQNTFKKVLRSNLVGEEVNFLWHAGEPLAAGIQFYEKALSYIKENNIYAKRVRNSVQTNATLINQKWCDFFKEHEFIVGVSADGPEFLHNKNRVGWSGKGSFDAVMEGINILRANNISFGGICVLTKESLLYPDEIYNFFMENGFCSFGFNIEEIETAHTTSSILDQKDNEFEEIQKLYFNFISRIFDLWKLNRGKLTVRELEMMTKKVVLQKTLTKFEPRPDETQGLRIITIRNDGNITTFSPELANGTPEDSNTFVVSNINEIDELEDIIGDKRYVSIRKSVQKGLDLCKDSCPYFHFCGGGSPSNKFYETGTFEVAETKSCTLHKKILADAVLDKLIDLTNDTTQKILHDSEVKVNTYS